jgi:voltage-gated potassium channel
MKRRIYNYIEHNPVFIKFIYTLIILNVVSLIIGSYKEIREMNTKFLDYFEIFSVAVFTIEYILRLWTADQNEDYEGGPFLKRIRFVFSTFGLIDLIAILPFYLPLILPIDLRIVRILRITRLIRIFKLGRYSKSMKTISSVLKETKSDLGITLFIAFIMLVLASTLMFYIESDVQPDKFASIGHSFWWAVATLTTVGYGDVYPVTAMGKILSGAIALIGVGIVALPTGIISSAFVEKISKKNKTCTCPNCGSEIQL